MRPLTRFTCLLLALGTSASACRTVRGGAAPLPPVGPDQLRAPDGFAIIVDRKERSQAMFLEASRVFLHPRCANCHPAGDTPLQGDEGRVHDPPVARGPHDEGVPALMCRSCHQDANLELARVPGAPHWALAPLKMAWVGRSPRDICQQIKDHSKNGGRSLEQIVDHVAHDELVGWGWHPGHERTPAPGTQAEFGTLVAAWVDTGAHCPTAEPTPEGGAP